MVGDTIRYFSRQILHLPTRPWSRNVLATAMFVSLCLLTPSLKASPQSDNGWGKDSTAFQQSTRRTVPQNTDPSRFADPHGAQKAGSIRPASASLPHVAQPPQPQRSPEELIRWNQQGAQKPAAAPQYIRDRAVRPASALQETPREVPPPYPSPEEDPAPIENGPPQIATSLAEQSVIHSEIVPYYQPHSYGPCDCPKCRGRRSSDWISLEALVWWTSDVSVPPLVSTSPNGTAPNLAGVPGANSDVLFGGGDIYDFSQAGFRARYGHWFDNDEVSGIEAEFFMLFEKGDNFYGTSNGDPILARPFTNVAAGVANGAIPDAQIVAYPGLNSGSVSVEADTWMYSIGLRYLHEIYLDFEDDECGESFERNSCEPRDTRWYFALGPRFYHLDDSIRIREEFTSTRSGNEYLLVDSFQSENSFLGGEIGLKARHRRGRWQADLGLNLAIGATKRELDIAGYSRIRNRNGGSEYAQGFLAQPTNIGSYDDTEFSLVPRFEFDLRWDFAERWTAMVGYNLIYWTNVWRAGEQIDGTIDAGQLPPPVGAPAGVGRPRVPFHETDFLAHGLSFGIEHRY